METLSDEYRGLVREFEAISVLIRDSHEITRELGESKIAMPVVTNPIRVFQDSTEQAAVGVRVRALREASTTAA